MNKAALLREVRQFGDFEWYPTTDEIIQVVKSRIKDSGSSVLDVGAGDGRVLTALTSGDKYAIEKSKPLIAALPADVFIIGTEFHEQTLLDKRVDYIFSNPPYSEYEVWAEKIILEAQAEFVYLVLPQRWNKSTLIDDAINARKGHCEVIYSTDFLSADRQARVMVDVIEICLNRRKDFRGRVVDCGQAVDPFGLWFSKNFPIDTSEPVEEPLKERVTNMLVAGNDLVSTLEQLYLRDFDKLINAYLAVSNIDGSILKELDVNQESLCGGLRQKAAGLKDKYWKLLFDNLDKVTDRLTSSSRSVLFNVLTKNTHVDFTRGNAYAVLEWVIKNANQYYEQQLIDIFTRMVEKANVINYASNKRTFGEEEWRYWRQPDNLSHFKLDLRIVLARIGGIDTSWSWKSGQLTERAQAFVNDLCTVAYNLGYDNSGYERAGSFHWESGKAMEFHFFNHEKNKTEVAFVIKAFKNGNLHIKFNQSLICKLNVEFGRLKGWIKSKEQAAEEINISDSDAEASFDSNHRLDKDVLMLCFKTAA